MKITVFISFLYFSIFAACSTYAGNNVLTASYPTPIGNYNSVVLNTQSAACSSTNSGMLLTDTNGNLEICANGSTTPVQYGETCFNLFCSCTAGVCSNTTACPTGAGFTNPATACPTFPQLYVQGKISGVVINDSFTSGTYTVYSTLCCYDPGGSGSLTTITPQ